MSGIYHADSIRDVADSLGLNNLSEGVASMLAADVEYRLHQIIEEAARFTRHSKRTTLSTTDIDQAFKVMNIEPVYGHSSLNVPSFRRAIPAVGPAVYALQDEEIDFDKIVREEEIPVPRPVSYTAHWLAIEGVQPLIPENPSPHIENKPPSSGATKARPQANGVTHHTPHVSSSSKPQLTTKAHLSRELQQYYSRLTDSLVPSQGGDGNDKQTERKRTAALSSLRADAGLQGILPYLVKWIGDSVINALAVKADPQDPDEPDVDRRILEVMLMVMHAILDNKTLFVEPYLHMLLPPVLSILLTSTLSSSSSYSSLPSPSPTPRTIRIGASSLVSHLLKLHAASYPSLPPRITKTFLVALLDDGTVINALSPDGTSNRKAAALGTKDGAIRGLIGVGREAVLRGIIGGRIGKSLGLDVEKKIRISRGMMEDVDEAMMDLSNLGGPAGREGWTEEVKDVVDSFTDALALIHPPPTFTPNDIFGAGANRPSHDELGDAQIQLAERIGPFFADIVSNKKGDGGTWAVGLAKVLVAMESSELEGSSDHAERTAFAARQSSEMEGLQAASRSEVAMGLGMGIGGDMGSLDTDAMDAT